jgi:uncharacterized membrane-anchored protein YjiN (DUF445 family)
VAEAEERALERRRDLSRMRALATGLLVAMAALFVAASVAEARWPNLGFVRAFAEAATVGACADWFAVTALFRRPLGLPIPHTAIIPRNKDRIGEALGAFIAGEFLTPRVLDQRLRELDLARRLADWLRRPGNAAEIARLAGAVIPEIIASGPELKSFAAEAGRRLAGATPAGPVASRTLAALWNEGRAQSLADSAVGWFGDYLAERRDFIREEMTSRTRWLPRFVDDFLADRFAEGLTHAVRGMREPGHPWRRELQTWVEGLIDRLAHDPATLARADEIKRSILDNPAFQAQVETLWTEAEHRLTTDPSLRAGAVETALERGVLALGRWLDEDAGARDRLNGWVRILVRRTVSPRRKAIGDFVAGVVRTWDAEDVVEKLELQVGRDLQYIRINGTVVGGLVGLLIYSAMRAWAAWNGAAPVPLW